MSNPERRRGRRPVQRRRRDCDRISPKDSSVLPAGRSTSLPNRCERYVENGDACANNSCSSRRQLVGSSSSCGKRSLDVNSISSCSSTDPSTMNMTSIEDRMIHAVRYQRLHREWSDSQFSLLRQEEACKTCASCQRKAENHRPGRRSTGDHIGDVIRRRASRVSMLNFAPHTFLDEIDSLNPDGNSRVVTGSDAVVLKRQIGVFDCVSIIVGVIIGSGIFVAPKGILKNTGGSVGVALIVWVLCGILSAVGALCYAELGTTFTKSGGDYIYLLESYGPLIAFLRLWTSLIAIRPAVVVVIAITFAKYVTLPVMEYCNVNDVVVRLVAALLICFAVFINCFSVPWTAQLVDLLTIGKVMGLLVIITTGLLLLISGYVDYFQDPFSGIEDISLENIPLGFYSGMFAYAGWFYINYVTEEIKEPARTLPKSVIISMVMVTIVYILTNVSYFTILAPKELLDSEAVAVDFAYHAFSSMAWTVPLFVALSTAGTVTANLLTTPRMFFVASREGHLPDALAMIHIRRFTPIPAVLVTLPICLMMLINDNVYSLINYLSFLRWLFIGLTITAIPYLRWKRPHLPRPFKVPLVLPIIFALCAFFMVGTSLYSAPHDCGIGLGIALTGVPVYYIGVYWKNKPRGYKRMMHSVTIFLQKLLEIIPQEEHTF
ncbi:cystine/glutamate transporter-like [Saccoglossus kowalevskii]|uniref:Cystine/glutamate transporter-like n=1 Tax=Saccoglossus kowalevskii TaxID=10224 RepID=A0ABM0GRY9_SACKO|nr:PREDICTED: cystine/glutamate transporter-like [Saccoglossus kowalevskii]